MLVFGRLPWIIDVCDNVFRKGKLGADGLSSPGFNVGSAIF